MMRVIFAVLVVIAAYCFIHLMVLAANAQVLMNAQLVCFSTAEAVDMFGRVQKQKPVAHGSNQAGFAVQLWLGHDGTFTILVSNPQGLSCPVSIGTDWSGENTIPKGKGL